MIKKIQNYKLCKGPISKTIGLMFKSCPKPHIFVFKTDKIIPIHTFFVTQAIDLIYLNKNKKVIEIKKNLKPYSFYKNKKPARYLLEMPKSRIQLRDIIKF